MPDTTIKKVEADYSPKGEMGQRYLVAGLWIDEPGESKVTYETNWIV